MPEALIDRECEWIILNLDSKKPQVDESAEKDILSCETDSVSSSLESDTTVVNNSRGDDRGRKRKENRVLWAKIRSIIRGTLALFVIASGTQNNAAIISRLAPIATLKHTRRGTVEDVSARVFALQEKIIAGITEKEEETELGTLFALAIYCRNKDQATDLVKMMQNAALSARQSANCAVVPQHIAEGVRVLEKLAIVSEKDWLQAELLKGLRVLAEKRTASPGTGYSSKLRLG